MMGGFKFVLQKDGVFAEHYHVNNADIHYGDNVVVFGIGPVGLMAVAGTALKGAGRIYTIGTRPNGIISNVNFLDATDTINFPAPLWGLGMSNVMFKSGFCPGGGRRIERLVRLIQSGRVHPGKLLNYKFEGFDKIAFFYFRISSFLL